jgi:hypothetical protein
MDLELLPLLMLRTELPLEDQITRHSLQITIQAISGQSARLATFRLYFRVHPTTLMVIIPQQDLLDGLLESPQILMSIPNLYSRTIYVSDWGSLLRKISNGIVTTIAGNTSSTTYKDGIGGAAGFFRLNGIVVVKGIIYSVEDGNIGPGCRLRMTDINGNVKTLVGASAVGYNSGPANVCI